MPAGPTTRPLPATPEGDYVACFRTLTEVEVKIREQGPRPDLLLRRSMLYLEMGDLKRGLESAQDAVAAAPRDGEAHYQEAMAWMALARLRAGAVVLGPGVDAPTPLPLQEALERAYEAFCAAARCRPSDPDARENLTFLEGILDRDEGVGDAFRRAARLA